VATSDRRLWVIDPSMDRAEDQGVAEILDGWAGQCRVFRPALTPGDGPGPETGLDTDGVVLMGSRASVFDDLGWLRELRSWVEPMVLGEARVPLLGICFGHQLIAHIAGAEVGFVSEDRAKRTGVETTVMETGRLLPGRHELRVVVSHREEVKSLPAGYRTVARRGSIEIDGLEHESLPVFSFQFHPEARDEFARHSGIGEASIDARVRHDNRRLLAAFRDQVTSAEPRT
jgi:GMP synthase-like glutamine amidotransferase